MPQDGAPTSERGGGRVVRCNEARVGGFEGLFFIRVYARVDEGTQEITVECERMSVR